MGKSEKRNLLKEEKGIRKYKGTTDTALFSNCDTVSLLPFLADIVSGNHIIYFKKALIAAPE